MGVKLIYLGIPWAIFVIAAKIIENVVVEKFLHKAKTQEQRDCIKILNSPRIRPYISTDERKILKSIDEVLYHRFLIFRACCLGGAALYMAIFIVAFVMDVFRTNSK